MGLQEALTKNDKKETIHAWRLDYHIRIYYYAFVKSMIYFDRRNCLLKKNLSKFIAKKTVAVLDAFLTVDANSSSCCIVYQPKAPKELERYRSKK